MAISSRFAFLLIGLQLPSSPVLRSSHFFYFQHHHNPPPVLYSLFRDPRTHKDFKRGRSDSLPLSYQLSRRGFFEEEDDDGGDDEENYSFDGAVSLFNNRDYYRCHDVLEALWNKAEEPTRTIIHAILQCAVGFHHLFNRNHRGAMMELGEGLCKLRKMNFEGGPFHRFEQEISATLDFIYQTQLELAACNDDFCIPMDQSERSYQLLGGFASGQHIYHLEGEPNETLHIVFNPEGFYNMGKPPRVKVPTLRATEEHLMACEYN